MRILLTNDDGIDAPGLAALRAAIDDLGEVHVVAPAKVESAVSHAVTFHRPMKVTQRKLPGFTGLAVAGRPADCVKLAIHDLIPETIDLCISGMNSGANVGVNVIYSGTVGAAREAAFHGVPAIAVSLHVGDWDAIRWEAAARHARETIGRVLNGPIQPHAVINVNVPILDGGAEPVGVRAVPACTGPLTMEYHKSPDGEHDTYQVANSMTFDRIHPDTDVDALFARYITITPLHYDLTHRGQLEGWVSHFGIAAEAEE